MDKEIENQIADLIGENLDRVVTIDRRCQGAIIPSTRWHAVTLAAL